MLSFIKKLFGSKPVEAAAPYKVETPSFPIPKEEAETVAVAKKAKATVKKASTRKPKAPKA